MTVRTRSWVWPDGAAEPEAEATVPAADRAVLLGVGVFETLIVVGGVPMALSRHLTRLRSSADIAGFEVPWDEGELRAAVGWALDAAPAERRGPAGPGDGTDGVRGWFQAELRLRITVTAGAAGAGAARAGAGPGGTGAPGVQADRSGGGGPRLVVTTAPQPPWGATTDVVIVDRPVNERSPLVGAKVTSHLEHVLVSEEARRRGAEEAIRCNTRGAVCEGASSNVFVVVDDILCTPSLATGCLPGTVRALVCETTEVVERADLTVEDLGRATEAFVTSSTRGVHPVRHLEGRALPAPGPHTSAAATALNRLLGRTLDP